MRVIALCRTKSKAENTFKDFLNKPYFTLLLQDVCEPIQYDGGIDYIFHLAGNASPHFINTDPVGIVARNEVQALEIYHKATNMVNGLVFCSIIDDCSNITVEI